MGLSDLTGVQRGTQSAEKKNETKTIRGNPPEERKRNRHENVQLKSTCLTGICTGMYMKLIYIFNRILHAFGKMSVNLKILRYKV